MILESSQDLLVGSCVFPRTQQLGSQAGDPTRRAHSLLVRHTQGQAPQPRLDATQTPSPSLCDLCACSSHRPSGPQTDTSGLWLPREVGKGVSDCQKAWWEPWGS